MKKAVLLLAFGGPPSMEEVEPFIKNVTEGHSIPETRIKMVLEQYRLIGGASPLNAITFAEAKSLEENLKKQNHPLKVYVGLRHSKPSIQDALLKMDQDGVEAAVGIVMAPHRSEASWNRYIHQVSNPLVTTQIKFCDPWHDHPLLIEAITARIEEAIKIDPQIKENFWLFSAHSIPVEMDKKSDYSGQIKRTVELVAGHFSKKNWEIVYQSRSGQPQDPWLTPDIGERIKELAATGVESVTAIPIGFIADHVEILYDLDIKAKTAAEEATVDFFRVKTVGMHPKFIELLTDLVTRIPGFQPE